MKKSSIPVENQKTKKETTNEISFFVVRSTGQNPVGFLFTNMMENNFKFRNQFFIKQVGIVRKLQNLWIGKFFPRIEVNHRYATMPYIKPCRKDRVKNIQLKGSVSIGNLILQLSHSLRQI